MVIGRRRVFKNSQLQSVQEFRCTMACGLISFAPGVTSRVSHHRPSGTTARPRWVVAGPSPRGGTPSHPPTQPGAQVRHTTWASHIHQVSHRRHVTTSHTHASTRPPTSTPRHAPADAASSSPAQGAAAPLGPPCPLAAPLPPRHGGSRRSQPLAYSLSSTGAASTPAIRPQAHHESRTVHTPRGFLQ